MRKISLLVPIALVIAALACGQSTGGSVSNDVYNCSSAGGVGSCQGTIGGLSGSTTKEFEVSGTDPLPVSLNATVGEGTLRVSFEAADGTTVSADASPGSPANLATDVSPSFDEVTVTFESIDGKVSDVAYSFEFGQAIVEPPAVEEPVVEEPAGGGDVGVIRVVNDTADTVVCFLLVSPSDYEEWGPDQLGEGTIILAGEEFTLTDIPLNTYDMRAEDCERNVIAEEGSLQLTAEGLTWTFTDE